MLETWKREVMKKVISGSTMHCLFLFRALSIDKNADDDQWCGLRPSVLGQDRSETKKSVLVLVLKFWCCVVKHGLVTLVVVMILKDTATFQVLFIDSLFCASNITTVDINSGVYLQIKSTKCLCLLPVVLVLVLVLLFWSWSLC